ncbi:replication initiation protein (plasmid) [Paracoccus marcusii]|uniref:replication initiation protein n=1 Tax=Paracoccus marcusii TaxID=59779 RepID=UPI0038BC3E6E
MTDGKTQLNLRLMIKTKQIAADRAHDETKTVLPAEVARGVYIENPPGAEALKLMHLLIGKAGGRMAEDVRHELRLADIKKIDGMRNHSRATLRKLFIELAGAVIVFDDTEAQCEIIGGFLDRAKLDYRHEVSDDLLVAWWFGGAFREMAEKSYHWAIMDRQTVFALSSKYSILLFQHVASLVNLDHVTSKTFTVSEMRAVLGVPDEKLKRWTHLNRDAIQPAIAEINQTSRLTLTATPRKVGRTVASVTIAWEEKPLEAKKETRRELDGSKVGRKARRDGTAESPVRAFPETGGITYSPYWIEVKRAAGCNRDNSLIAADFRRFCDTKGIRLDAHNIEELFSSFCAKVGRS